MKQSHHQKHKNYGLGTVFRIDYRQEYAKHVKHDEIIILFFRY